MIEKEKDVVYYDGTSRISNYDPTEDDEEE